MCSMLVGRCTQTPCSRCWGVVLVISYVNCALDYAPEDYATGDFRLSVHGDQMLACHHSMLLFGDVLAAALRAHPGI